MSQDLLKNAVCTDFHGCFAKFDVNGDGSISHEEFDQVRGPEWVGVGVWVGV
jgi:Ca2+-binding EF-hand superfamily protein